MDVCYNKLFKMLIDEGLKKGEFRKKVGISEGTLSKLSRNENVSMDVIVKICREMNCTVDEIMDVLPSPVNGTDKNIES
ncbi:MAG: helix-turn-helix transcriptional regulator [Lachnospiraceae bacterium]|nr:helix-turn-helix transcriptional regulator [Lachnospiraceae bacterium]MBR4085685.1 helix-turn-helix transcriptional regulator [Lachnospiraceae bacterium]